jgi:DNA-binding transcriptional ArsR family regulator
MNPQALESNAESAADLLAALANRRRLAILCRLVEGERSVGALAESLGIGQSALSQHLAKLREQGLVSTRREGQTIYYRIASPQAEAILATLHEIYCA